MGIPNYPVAMPEISDQLLDFALFALDHAADSVLAGGGALVPFSIVEVDGERQLNRFVGDLEEGQRLARSHVASTPDVSRAAVAWDGYLTVEGQRTDAVFVEASEVGESRSVLFAQRYGASGRLRKRLERIGNAAVVGEGEPLF